MYDYLPVAGLALVLLWLARKLLSLRATVAVAKATGLPYAISREFMARVSLFKRTCSSCISPEWHRWLLMDGSP